MEFVHGLPEIGPNPTEPFKALLDPLGTREMVAPLVSLAAPLLREVVNFSSHAFIAAQEGTAQAGLDEAWAPLYLHHNIIEMADAIEVLVREGCAYAAIGPLRSAFESELYLAFILGHGDRKKAALAWLVGKIRREITSLERSITAPESVKDAAVTGSPTEGLVSEASARLEALRAQLQAPHLMSIAAEVQGGNWFGSLCGAKNLSELSVAMDSQATGTDSTYSRAQAYLFLYSRHAEILHGSDYRRIFRPGKDGTAAIVQWRHPEVLAEVARVAVGTLLSATRLQVRSWRPDLDGQLVAWYVAKVQEAYGQLNAVKVTCEEQEGS